VIGGVVAGTVLAIFFVPLRYLIIRSLSGRRVAQA